MDFGFTLNGVPASCLLTLQTSKYSSTHLSQFAYIAQAEGIVCWDRVRVGK
jgi:hypothetical protein